MKIRTSVKHAVREEAEGDRRSAAGRRRRATAMMKSSAGKTMTISIRRETTRVDPAAEVAGEQPHEHAERRRSRSSRAARPRARSARRRAGAGRGRGRGAVGAERRTSSEVPPVGARVRPRRLDRVVGVRDVRPRPDRRERVLVDAVRVDVVRPVPEDARHDRAAGERRSSRKTMNPTQTSASLSRRKRIQTSSQ